MGLFDKIKEFVAGEEESPVTAASVLAKVREKYPHLRGIDDLSLSQSLYKKDPAKFSYLKTYAPDTTVPPALVPKSMRDDAFYKANPQEGTKDALKVIEQVKSKFPKYKGVDAKRLAVALETKNPTMFAGLSKKLMPGQTAIPKGETEAATIPLIPSGTMGATKPVSPVQVTPPVRPIETKPEPKVRPSVTSISPEEAKLPDGTKPLKFKNGIEAYLAVEKLAKPTLVEYPGRHGQTIRRIMTTEIPSFPPPPEDKGKDLVGKIVGKEEAFARGVGVSGAQVPELAYGATALVADSAEKLFGSGTASRVKDWALRGYQRASKVSEEVHGDEVKSVVESWKEAKKGNLDALGDWLSYWSGYGAGQLGESAAVAFLGGLVGSVIPGPGTAAGAVAGVTAKTATKGVIRGALERLVERQALKLTAEGVAAAEAKRLAVKQIATAIGAASAIGAYAVVQEGGSIYPDAVKKAEEDGRKLNGYDLGRVWGTIFVAAGTEGLGDMLGLGFLTGNVRIPGRLGKVARIVGTAASGGLAEGGTEAIQTAVERVGAGRKPFDQAGIQDIIESAAAGAIPGLGAGGVGAIISGQPRANVQSLAATEEASPELLSYLDRVEKINRARLEMPEKLDLTPERPQMQPFVPAPPIPRSTAPVNEIVKTHAKSIMNEAVSEYNLERDRFSRWRDLIGPGLRPPRVLPGNRDVMGEYNTLPVWQKSGKGRFADEVAEEAVSVGLISKPEDIYDALRSLKAPSNPSRNVEDYYDEAQRFVDAEQPDTQPERKYPETEMPNFSASKKEDVTKGPARAEFIGYQEGLPEDTPIPLYNVMGESPRALSTVGSEELKSLGIETPKTPSFEEWKAGGDVTEGQVSAKKLIEKLASANEISDAVAVEFVKHITPTGENFYKSYGEEFSPEKFRVLGATIPQYTQNGLNFAIKLAQGAKESTGAHEMFHAMKQMGFFSQDEMRVLEGRFGNEEKIADALGEYATRRTGAEAQSRIKAIFDRFLDFVKRVGSMLVGRGWTRAEDIFESVVKGRPGKRASGSEGSTRFSAPPQEPVFYSQLQRTIEAKMPNQAPTEQVKGIIGGGAVKQDEIDWSGINDFLAGKKTVTKAELLDFLKANQVEVKEVEKSDSHDITSEEHIVSVVKKRNQNGNVIYKVAFDSGATIQVYDTEVDSEAEARALAVKVHNRDRVKGMTKFSNYQLPGGENYREVLLTLPIMKGESAKNIVDAAMRRADELDWDWSKLTTAEKQKLYNEIENRVGGTKQKFISSHFDEPNILAHVRMNDRVSFPVGDRPSPLVDPEGQKSGADSLAADAKLLSDVVESAAFREKGLGGLDVETRKAVLSGVVRAVRDPQVFRGVVPLIPVDVVNNLVRAKLTAEQFLRDEAMLTDSLSANPDAAIKLSEGAIGRLVRSVADLTTKRVFGSTDGRGKFIAGSSAPSAIDSHRGKRILFIEEIQSDWAQGLRAGKDHPKMPFAKTWHELALKRMIRYAAENGYDAIAWTTGEQQVKRYPEALRQVADHIEWDSTSDGKGVSIYKNGARILEADVAKDGTLTRATVDKAQGKHLSEVIGKTMAQKVIDSTHGKIKGEEFTVGGEGMKGFYDQIIPSFLNKYTKKWGGRVGESKINTGPSEENRTALQEAERTGDSALIADAAGKGKDRMETVHSLDITPSMRESLSQGQPMFSAERDLGEIKPNAQVDKFQNESDFLKYHQTGFIPSHAYESYGKRGGLDFFGGVEENKILLKEKKFGGELIQFRQTGRKNKYVKIGADNEIVRDAEGNATYLTDEEIKSKGLPTHDTAIVAFNSKGEVIGGAADEFGTDGVWVINDYQKRGIGTELLYEFRKQFNPDRKIGQMTNAGRKMAAAYFRRINSGVQYQAESKNQTDTPEFKRWFGASVVTDNGKPMSQGGKPLVVYKAMYPYDWRKQGSTEPLSVISRPTEFPAFNKGEPGVKIAGFFGDQNVANRFAAGAGNGQAIYPVYLSLKNPYVVDANGATAGSVQFGESGKAFRDAIRSNQYDGAIIRNTSDEGTIYVALEPTQIKSATGNIGTFDPNNPSILYQAERIPPTPEKISEAASQITTITPPKNESDVTKVGGQSLSKDVNEIPIFQGGKRELASRIGAAALRNWTDQERRSVSSMTDAFGGSGGWGLWLANHIFPGVKTIRLNELDGDRLLKIKYFHDHGNELRKAFYQSGLDERLASLYDEMAKAGVQSGSALGNRISTIRNSITDETQRAILAAIEDYVSHQRGVRTVNDAVDAAARDADYVYKAAAKFRARGGKFEYVNGDAYKLETPQGPNHVVVFDPPYYGTAGYGTGTVPISIYRMTGDFLRKTAANKNNIVYTDSLWMAKPANDLPSDWRQGALDVWAKIKQAIGRVGAAAGKVGAGRREVIGLHNAFKAGEVIDVEPRREENAGGGVAPSGEVGGDEQPGRGGGEAPVGDAGGGVAGRTEGEAAPIHGEAAGRGSQLTPETPGSPYFAAPSSNAHRRVPPPVLEALQSAEGKLNDLTVGQAGELSTLAPTRAMEVMDGKRFGLMKDHFLKPIQDADKSFQIELKSMRAEAKAVLHGLTADERRSVYNAIDLKHPIHSDEVKRAVDFLRKTYDDLLDRINTARAAAGKDPVQKRQNYITHYQELSVLNDILDMIGLNMTEVPNSMLTISMFTKPNSPYFQFAKRRLGEQTERDAEQAFLRYLEPALRTIHFSPATKNARDIIEYKVKIPSEYEGGKIDTVSLFGIRYPNAYRYLTNYLNVVSGKRPILDKIFPQGAAIAGVMNKLFAAGSIGGNISTVITQAASLRNTIAETGLFAFKGQMLINTPKGYRFFKKNSRIGLGRQYEPSTKGTRLLGSKALAKTHEAVSDLISIPVGLFDREMVGGAFLAGYFKGRSIGLSEADAIRYGDDVAERTQASANIVDRPPINTGKLKTALGQFQTFIYNEWSQIRNDMVKKAVRGENSKQGYGDGLSGIREGRDVGFKRFLYFSIAAIILSSMYDEADLPNPLKQEAFSLPFGNHHVNTVFQHIVNQIPFVGNIRFGGPPVVQMIKLSVDVFGHVRDRKIALRRLQNIGLRLIPGGGQISKSINAHRYFFKVPPQTMADKVRGYMFGPRRWEILNDDMRWLKENAGRLGLTRSKAYQYLNKTSTRSLLAETEKERTEARAKVESYAKRLRVMAESREAELLAREERRKARLAARR